MKVQAASGVRANTQMRKEMLTLHFTVLIPARSALRIRLGIAMTDLIVKVQAPSGASLSTLMNLGLHVYLITVLIIAQYVQGIHHGIAK